MAQNAIQELAALPDATRLTLRPGQVLYYRDHVPPGVFVVETGELTSDSETTPGTLRPPGPPGGAEHLVLPHPTELARRSAATVTAVTEATVLFVPRSTIANESQIQRLLERLAGPAGEGSPRTAP